MVCAICARPRHTRQPTTRQPPDSTPRTPALAPGRPEHSLRSGCAARAGRSSQHRVAARYSPRAPRPSERQSGPSTAGSGRSLRARERNSRAIHRRCRPRSTQTGGVLYGSDVHWAQSPRKAGATTTRRTARRAAESSRPSALDRYIAALPAATHWQAGFLPRRSVAPYPYGVDPRLRCAAPRRRPRWLAADPPTAAGASSKARE